MKLKTDDSLRDGPVGMPPTLEEWNRLRDEPRVASVHVVVPQMHAAGVVG